MNMELENMNGAVELSMDELALVNGGGIVDFVKGAVKWVSNHGDEIKEVINAGKKVYNWIRGLF
jgi:hypothetical protein